MESIFVTSDVMGDRLQYVDNLNVSKFLILNFQSSYVPQDHISMIFQIDLHKTTLKVT
jgi:tyrosine-protein phosphatase YwqE